MAIKRSSRAASGSVRRKILRHWQLYLLLIFPVIYLAVFKYTPMVGLQIAFKDFNPGIGMFASEWAGFKHFTNFFKSHEFIRLISNTLIIGTYQMVLNIPCPIILGIAINSCVSGRYGKFAQMITYAPYFISTVIITTMIMQILAVRGGLVNNIIMMLGGEPVNLMADPGAFRHIYVLSGVWQSAGYGAVIYIAALAGINPELYEAATIDGASVIQRIRHIDIPGILPVCIMLLIMSCGNIINVGYEKVLLLQNPLNMQTADVISTYVYRMGITSAQYSYSSAIGFFNSVVSITLLLLADWFARSVGETSLF